MPGECFARKKHRLLNPSQLSFPLKVSHIHVTENPRLALGLSVTSGFISCYGVAVTQIPVSGLQISGIGVLVDGGLTVGVLVIVGVGDGTVGEGGSGVKVRVRVKVKDGTSVSVTVLVLEGVNVIVGINV